MAWFKVDDGFANSRPVLAIPRRYRAAAAGLWVLAGTWSSKELTDGFIPDYVIEELGGTPAIAEQLVRAGLWQRVEGGYQMIGWAKYQFTKEQVLARRAAEVERKRAAREAARNRSYGDHKSSYGDHNNTYDGLLPNCREITETASDGYAQAPYADSPAQTDLRPNDVRADKLRRPHVVRPVSEHPDPTRPDPTRTTLSLVTSSGGVALVDAPEPPRQCQSHINDPTPPRCGRCADARRLHSDWTSARKAKRDQDKADHRRAVDACTECDHHGMVETDHGLVRCDHTVQAHA